MKPYVDKLISCFLDFNKIRLKSLVRFLSGSSVSWIKAMKSSNDFIWKVQLFAYHIVHEQVKGNFFPAPALDG